MADELYGQELYGRAGLLIFQQLHKLQRQQMMIFTELINLFEVPPPLVALLIYCAHVLQGKQIKLFNKLKLLMFPASTDASDSLKDSNTETEVTLTRI